MGLLYTEQATVRFESMIHAWRILSALLVWGVFVVKGTCSCSFRLKLASQMEKAEEKTAKVEVKELWALQTSIGRYY